MDLAATVLRSINTWMHRILMVIAQVALAAMTLIVCYTVLLRYVFNTGVSVAEEAPRLLVDLITFVAMAMGVRDWTHISADIVYNRFRKGGKMQYALDQFARVIVLLCGFFMLWVGMQRLLQQMGLSGTLPATGLPVWVPVLPIPVCGFMIVFDTLLYIFGVLKPGDKLFADPESDEPKPGEPQEAEKEVQPQ